MRSELVKTPPIRAAEILSRLPAGPVTGVEIGVDRGHLSAELLKRIDLCLFMVDPWDSELSTEHYKNTDDYHAFLPKDICEQNYREAIRNTDFAVSRRLVLRMPSAEAVKYVVDWSLDFAFIDGDHSFEGCSEDIDIWRAKVKPGGILAGHDYNDIHNPKFGVSRAVDENVKKNGWILELGENYTWFAVMP